MADRAAVAGSLAHERPNLPLGRLFYRFGDRLIIRVEKWIEELIRPLLRLLPQLVGAKPAKQLLAELVVEVVESAACDERLPALGVV